MVSVMLTALLVNAQDLTTYRGAFAPAPEPQWTDNWTNWDPNGTVYPATTVNISGSIVANTTWAPPSVYKISGIVYVNNGVTLTILPGTIIRGDETVANSSLFVARGGKINALGTACNPIVFTSNKAIGQRAKGDWGGLVLLGKGLNNLGTNVQIEGTAAGEPRNFHGGTDNDDNSGILKYVRIEFGGYVFAPNSEINGLTMGSVGRGTTIDHIQTSFGNDDAFEWFGGAVNCKYLVSYRNLDDDFDTDNGYSGLVQYGLSIKDPAIADVIAVSTSEGFESDNNAGGTAAAPKTSGRFYNITQIGAFRCNTTTPGVLTQPSADGFRRGARLRRNTELKIYNSLFLNNWRGLVVDAPSIANGQVGFQNNVIAGDFATVWVAPYAGVALYGEDAATTTFLNTAAYNNSQVSSGACDILTNVWGATNLTFPSAPDFRPNAAGSGAVLTSGATSGTDLFPFIEIDGSLFTVSQSRDFLVDVIENGLGSSSGTITVTIPKPSGWDIGVEGLTLVVGVPQSGVNNSSDVNGGTLNNNGDWTFLDNGANIIATSKPSGTVSIPIPISNLSYLGLTATRKGATSNGTNQNLSANVTGGGDNSPSNNSAVVGFSAN